MAPTTTTRIAGRIDRLRKSKGISLDDLALATGIPRTTLSRKMRDGGLFTINELIAVSRELDVDADSWLAN